MKGQEQKCVGKSAIKADFLETHALRNMDFKFFPKQFRDGADDWFGLAKRIDGDVEGKMRVWQVYLAQPPLLQLLSDHVFWQAAPAEARDQKLLLCVQVADVPAALDSECIFQLYAKVSDSAIHLGVANKSWTARRLPVFL